MDFSNEFKKRWWKTLLIVLSIIIFLIIIEKITLQIQISTLIFIIWFILVLFPIISEISLFGISIKKEIESFKKEILNSINQNNNQVNISFPPAASPASKKDRQRKTEEETKEQQEEENSTPKLYELEESRKQNTERYQKIIMIENLVKDFMQKKYGERYQSSINLRIDFLKKTLLLMEFYVRILKLRRFLKLSI